MTKCMSTLGWVLRQLVKCYYPHSCKGGLGLTFESIGNKAQSCGYGSSSQQKPEEEYCPSSDWDRILPFRLSLNWDIWCLQTSVFQASALCNSNRTENHHGFSYVPSLWIQTRSIPVAALELNFLAHPEAVLAEQLDFLK